MQGKIIKGIAGFYYVQAKNGVLYACKAKGIFRNRKEKPLVGDNVEMEVTHEGDREGNITDILPRSSMLLRPAVANVDQALVLFAAAKPKPNLSLLDRFLIMMDRQKIPALICFNKTDQVSGEETERLRGIYAGCKSRLLFISAKYGNGLEELNSLLKNHTTTVAGPSGVGKSTLINLLAPHAGMETGDISEKIDRGKHTTRHSELFCLENGGYIFDTPGFSSLELGSMEKEELRYSFPEFAAYEGRCRFQGCVHINEPGCAVKQAVESGAVHKERYESYRALFEELKEREKRRYT